MPLLLIFLTANGIDAARFHDCLGQTEGVGMYTKELDYAAETAETQSACQEGAVVYYLTEQGFLPNFIYLTDNQIKVEALYSASFSSPEAIKASVRQYQENNYTVCLLYVTKEEKEDIISLGFRPEEDQTITDSAGNTVCHIFKLSAG